MYIKTFALIFVDFAISGTWEVILYINESDFKQRFDLAVERLPPVLNSALS